MKFSLNKQLILIGALILVLVLLLFGVWSARDKQPDAKVVLPQLEPRDIVLYFADPTGVALVSKERQIPGCNDERQCIARTIEALTRGSKELPAILPQGTHVIGVEIEGDLARVNFSRDLVNKHPGGTLSELLTVYGLANTLTVNFPSLERLQILVEGQIQATLKGHVDISRPIKAEFRYSYIPDTQESYPASEGDNSAEAATKN